MYAPFTGVLLLPDASFLGTTSTVTTADGAPVATIHREPWGVRRRFEIRDAAGESLLATGAQAGFWGNKYELMGPQSQFLLSLKFSGWTGPTGPGVVSLPDGRVLTTKGSWTARQFTLADEAGTPVAELSNRGGLLAARQSLAFELRAPVLSVLQAIGLAQCLRAAVESAATAVVA
ncbi:LURP-one-related/scramblase family protein [Couchioplanes azureus]|uniref:hypothetical protein n=1 Tax=Couchioplanes caeruleus TaxID=56438 RepID=UPI001670C336|nr:hypothetical protein [Couchioplanes caeruleus]GGQ56418.1 hypothetical protein GCM10010166_27380 [Couchioplanes caeruleus subsp. azureus]